MPPPESEGGKLSAGAEPDRLDRLAHQALEALAPLSFVVARTPLEIDAVLRMRYECVVEMGWANAEDYPDGRERDDYDEGATFIVCRDGDAMVACARLVPPAIGELLPVEREFRIQVPPPGRPVEVGRVIVAREHRASHSHLILAGLFARSWLIARELGHERVVSTASALLIELYRGLGLIITVLAPPKLSWGEQRAPIELGATEHGLQPLARATGVSVRRAAPT
jgi:N-acyl-L-homoserine lactone synthetase